MANPRLPNITEAEQELLYEKLNVYNQGKASYKEAGCYLVVLPREGHPNYSLWFYTPLLDRQCILFIEDLKPDIIQSLRIVTSELWYANRQILVTDYNEKRMSTHGDDLIAFGKYRGHFLYEILRIDPGYVNWIAFKYTPIIPKQERFVKMAQAYNCVYLDKMLKKKYQPRPTSRFLGKKGDKLSNLTLKITKVRVEDDPYRTRVIGTTPVFFVRQQGCVKPAFVCDTDFPPGRGDGNPAVNCYWCCAWSDCGIFWRRGRYGDYAFYGCGDVLSLYSAGACCGSDF